MRLASTARYFLALTVLLFCSAHHATGQEASDPTQAARQLAAEADDNAAGVEDRREALRKLEEAARLFLSDNETIEAACALNRAGRLQLSLYATRDASASHLKALDLLKKTPDARAEVDALNGLGASYLLLNKGGDALTALHKSLSLSERSGYTAGQAQALLTLSEEQIPYDHALALETAQKSLTLWQEVGDERGTARAYSHVGQYYMAQNALPESTQSYQQALSIWRGLNDQAEQAEVLIMLGFIEFRRGEWSACISLLTEAQGMLDEDSNPLGMGQIAAALADAFNENGMPESGLVQFRRALDYYLKTNDPHLISVATWGIGKTYYQLQNYPEAVTYLNQVLAGLGDDSLRAQCYEYLGRVFISTGKYDLALDNLRSAFDIYTRAVNPREAAQVLGLLGQLSELQGRPELARKQYRRALAGFLRLSDRVNEAAVYFALGRLELRGGDYGAAEAYLRQSIEITENLRRAPASSDLAAAFSATVHERYENYIECLMRQHRALPSQGLDIRAFEASELARGRSLAELLQTSATELVPGIDPELAREERDIRQSLRVKEDARVTMLAAAYKKDELEALAADITRLEAEYERVAGVIRSRYPAYERMTSPAAWSLSHIQEQVIGDDQTVLVEYSLGTDRSYVWAVTRDAIECHELPAQAQINDAAGKLYNLLATPPRPGDSGELNSAARAMAEIILSPVAPELRNRRRVIFVADGALNYIPFQVLPAPSADGEPLIADYEVVNAPSATILGGLRQEAERRQPASKILAAFGNPVFASDYARDEDARVAPALVAQTIQLERWRSAMRDIELGGGPFDPSTLGHLFYAKWEMANLREAAGGDSFVAEGYDATREGLVKADLTQYAILHFATHGLLDPKHPENSGLVLSTVSKDGSRLNGFVGLQDIYSIRAPVELVVLSACQTALGKDVRGEGLMGLTRGFMYAGASGVVASLWKVEDKATTELMKQFYAGMLQKGLSPGAALREAQNNIRKNPRWHSPYYWAGFILQGEYSRPIRHAPVNARSRLGAGVAAASLMLLLAGAEWYRRRRLHVARGRA